MLHRIREKVCSKETENEGYKDSKKGRENDIYIYIYIYIERERERERERDR